MKTNTNCHRALNMKHHWFQLCWFQQQWVFWLTHCGQTPQLQLQLQLQITPEVFSFLEYYKCIVLTGWKVIYSASKNKKWRKGAIISSSSSTKHDYYFHMVVCQICVNPIQASGVTLKTLTLSPATPLCPTWPSSPCGYGCVSQECRKNDWISVTYGDWCTTHSRAIVSWRARGACGALFTLGKKKERNWPHLLFSLLHPKINNVRYRRNKITKKKSFNSATAL